MSKISTIYDNLVVAVNGSLTDYDQITNPYAPDENCELFLDKGFGIAFGPGANSERQLGCKISIKRTFDVMLINLCGTTENNLDDIENFQKTMHEDQFLIIKALENDSDLSTSAAQIKFVDDNGLEFLETDRNKFFLLQSTFMVEYFENLT